MAGDPKWNFTDPASKENLLSVLLTEMDEMFELVSDPEKWESPTPCEGWQVRDIAGHIVDVTEAYLPAFDIAREGGQGPDPLGLTGMAKLADEGAKSLRSESREALIDRWRDDAKRMMDVFAGLSSEEWTSLMVPHKYMGPVPAGFFAEFQLIDYSIHGWDIWAGQGVPHTLSADAADLLVPVIHILLQYTSDTSDVKEPYSVGLRISGRNGDEMRAEVSSEGVKIEPGRIDDCPVIFDFDPATFVLTAYGRMNGGTMHGDRDLARRFRGLFFSI